MTQTPEDKFIPDTADIDLIRSIIPHRYPFLLIDRVGGDRAT